MVFFTFDDAVTSAAGRYYKVLFGEERKNPNGCPIKMTLFVSHNYTNYDLVKEFNEKGMEIASHSVTHTNLEGGNKFMQEAMEQRQNLARLANISIDDIVGWRSPFLKSVTSQPQILKNIGYTYDSTLTYSKTSLNEKSPTPFTLDFGWPYKCMIPPCPRRKHKGFWEVPIVSLIDYVNEYPCVYVDGCRSPPPTEQDAYNFLWQNFESYYNNSRTPFGINMHSAWFYVRHRFRAMDRFIKKLCTMDDVYILSVRQVIEWFKQPTSINNIKHFKPWSCPQAHHHHDQRKSHFGTHHSYRRPRVHTRWNFSPVNHRWQPRSSHSSKVNHLPYVHKQSWTSVNNQGIRERSNWQMQNARHQTAPKVTRYTEKPQYPKISYTTRSFDRHSTSPAANPYAILSRSHNASAVNNDNNANDRQETVEVGTMKRPDSVAFITYQRHTKSPSPYDIHKQKVTVPPLPLLPRPSFLPRLNRTTQPSKHAGYTHSVRNDKKKVASHIQGNIHAIKEEAHTRSAKIKPGSSVLSAYAKKKMVLQPRIITHKTDQKQPTVHKAEHIHPIISNIKHCVQNVNCFLPNCMCQTTDIPGQLTADITPQIVYFTIDGGVNVQMYRKLVRLFNKKRRNPNKCSIKATLFVDDMGTRYTLLRQLHISGFEVAQRGMYSNNYGIATEDILTGILTQKEKFTKLAGIPKDKIRGWRSPEFKPLGDLQYESLVKNNVTYDSTLVTGRSRENFKMQWPYTLDFGFQQNCVIPSCPTKKYVGLWEVISTPLLDYRKLYTCIYADGCNLMPPTAGETFEFLWHNFQRNYNSSRAPIGIRLKQDWFHWFYLPNLKGLEKFIDKIISLPDTYVTTITAMLDWVRSPTPLSELNDFKPWQC